MAPSTPLLLVVVFWVTSGDSRATSTVEVTAQPGENVTLTCQVNNSVVITAVEWTRTDLESPHYVYLQRDGHIDTTHQHPSFTLANTNTSRVWLEDRQMTDGNLNLILRNVTRSDNGVYECRFFSRGVGRINKRAIMKSEPSSIINLRITERKDRQRQRLGLGPALALGLGAVGVVVLGVIGKRTRARRHNDGNSDVTAAEEEVGTCTV